MIDKTRQSAADAVADIPDGASILIGGFGEAGSPVELIHALIDQGACGLTVISNNAGSGWAGLAALIANRRVAKMICSFPRTANSVVFADLYRSGAIELELVPQGTLAERIRAGGAGIPAFFTPTAAGTVLAKGKETRAFDGRDCVLEYGIRADYALVKAETADRYGNLLYRRTARNFGPIMCMAARNAIAQVRRIVPAGGIDPESVVSPGIFVDRIVEVPDPVQESRLVAEKVHYP